jgi:hypothetical protein
LPECSSEMTFSESPPLCRRKHALPGFK